MKKGVYFPVMDVKQGVSHGHAECQIKIYFVKENHHLCVIISQYLSVYLKTLMAGFVYKSSGWHTGPDVPS